MTAAWWSRPSRCRPVSDAGHRLLPLKLTVEQVGHVAELARLGMTDAEKERLSGELSKILDYIDQLEQLDTSSVEPTAQVGGLLDILREDRVTGSLSVEAALSNAPAADGGYFRVRAMQE